MAALAHWCKVATTLMGIIRRVFGDMGGGGITGAVIDRSHIWAGRSPIINIFRAGVIQNQIIVGSDRNSRGTALLRERTTGAKVAAGSMGGI